MKMKTGLVALMSGMMVTGAMASNSNTPDSHKSLFDLKKNFSESVKLVDMFVGKHGDLYEKLKNAAPDERQQAWLEYWKQFDPTPGTDENEYLDEFKARVDFVNQNFSSHTRKGYLTDMGLVYIAYGPPNEVDRYPFRMSGKPLERWEYYKPLGQSLDRAFIFVDRVGTDEPANYQLWNLTDMPHYFEY